MLNRRAWVYLIVLCAWSIPKESPFLEQAEGTTKGQGLAGPFRLRTPWLPSHRTLAILAGLSIKHLQCRSVIRELVRTSPG
jgi:hypothetical protein